MIEYIYDAVKATAGEEIVINAKVKDEEGSTVVEGCYLSLLDDEKEIYNTQGIYDAVDTWAFTIPAEITANLTGRFWYKIGCYDKTLSFAQPLYLRR